MKGETEPLCLPTDRHQGVSTISVYLMGTFCSPDCRARRPDVSPEDEDQNWDKELAPSHAEKAGHGADEQSCYDRNRSAPLRVVCQCDP
jgi:hypothetical protein